MPHGASPDAQSRFMAWTHCNLAKGLRGFSPLIGQRHPQALVRGVIGVSHLAGGIVVLEEGHEYWRRVVVGFA